MGETPDAKPSGASGSVEGRQAVRCPGPRTPLAGGSQHRPSAYLVLHAFRRAPIERLPRSFVSSSG